MTLSQIISGAGDLLLIGSERSKGSGKVVTRHYPGTGESVRQVRMASPEDVNSAVTCAQRAFPVWRSLPPGKRRDLMLNGGALLLKRTDHLAKLAALDAGLTVETTRALIRNAAEWLIYYAGWIDKMGGETVPTGAFSMDYVRHEPYGVVGVISPSNSSVSAMILAPLLAAGNCAVIKPSEFTSLVTAEYLQVFLDAGFPAGVVNSVPGDATIGECLIAHPGIAKIHFTGSCNVGARVASLAAQALKPVGLELGGKSANIVFSDADIDIAADVAMRSLVRQSGQSCVAGTRVIVHRSIAENLLEQTIAKTLSQKIGDPLNDDTAMGPVVSAMACDRILSTISRAESAKSGRLVLGGTRLGGELEKGYFISPTIFYDVDNTSPLAQEETFGPVISFIVFDSDDDAIALANSSDFGLAAYIQTKDLRKAHHTAAQLDVGTIWINGAVGVLPGGPFGGAKQSGYGRVGGAAGLYEFTRPKNVWVGY